MPRALRAVLAFSLVLASFSARAETGTIRLQHTGRLVDGDAPVTGTAALVFSIHSTSGLDTTVDDPEIWSASGNVSVFQGVYSVELGATPFAGATSLAAAFAQPGDRFLGVAVNGTDLKPRLRIGMMPLAMRALDAAALEGLSLAQLDTRFDAKYLATGGKATSAALADEATHALKATLADEATHAARATLADEATHADAADSADSAKALAGGTVVDANGLKIKGTLVIDDTGRFRGPVDNLSTDAATLTGRTPADPAASSAAANANKVSILDANGKVPANALPSTSALTATSVTADTITATTLKIGNQTLFSFFDGVQRPCSSGALQTFNGNTGAWSACPATWTCGTVPTHPGCASASDYASCKKIKDDTAFAGTDGPYFIDPDGASGPLAPFRVWCDMTTLGGGWTMVAKTTGNVTTTLNGDDTARWLSKSYLGDTANLNAEEALGTAYESVPTTHILIRSLANAGMYLAWSHPATFPSLWSEVNKKAVRSDGTVLGGSVAGLDYRSGCTGAAVPAAGGSYQYGLLLPDSHNVYTTAFMGYSIGSFSGSVVGWRGVTNQCSDYYAGGGFGFKANSGGAYGLNRHICGYGSGCVLANWPSNTAPSFNPHGLFVR